MFAIFTIKLIVLTGIFIVQSCQKEHINLEELC